MDPMGFTYIYICLYVYIQYIHEGSEICLAARMPKVVSGPQRRPKDPKGKVAWCLQKFASTGAGFYASIFHMLPNAICKIERQMLLYSNLPGTYKNVAPKSMVSLISDQSHDENPPKSSKYLPLTLPTS